MPGLLHCGSRNREGALLVGEDEQDGEEDASIIDNIATIGGGADT
jgi:hypothetical protein